MCCRRFAGEWRIWRPTARDKVDSHHSRLNLRARRRAGVRIPVLAVLALVGGCSTVPLVQDAGTSGPSVFDECADARAVEATNVDGVRIRGALVESSDGEYLVLHLLPSGASVTTGISAGIGRIGLASTLGALRDEGFSSVVFDYRGVGGSEGRRRTDRLIEDGRTMWREAVRLAGGRPDRVIVRAGSLGTLVAADLLARGEEPVAVVLFAPVRASSIGSHAAAAHRNPIGAWFADTFLSAPNAPDLEKALARTNAEILLVLPEQDEYLPADEHELIRSAAEAGGRRFVVHPSDHQTLILRSWGFTIDREAFSGRRTPELLEVESEFIHAIRRGASGRQP